MQPPSIEMHKRAHFQPRPTPSPDPGPLCSSTRLPTLARATSPFPFPSSPSMPLQTHRPPPAPKDAAQTPDLRRCPAGGEFTGRIERRAVGGVEDRQVPEPAGGRNPGPGDAAGAVEVRHPAVRPVVLQRLGGRHTRRRRLLCARLDHQGLQPSPFAAGGGRSASDFRTRRWGVQASARVVLVEFFLV